MPTAGPHHVRAAYRWAASVAVYVDPGHQGKGIGRELYGALLPLLARQNLRWACAGISLSNPASVRLHESFGFRPVAVFPRSASGRRVARRRLVAARARGRARVTAG